MRLRLPRTSVGRPSPAPEPRWGGLRLPQSLGGGPGLRRRSPWRGRHRVNHCIRPEAATPAGSGPPRRNRSAPERVENRAREGRRAAGRKARAPPGTAARDGARRGSANSPLTAASRRGFRGSQSVDPKGTAPDSALLRPQRGSGVRPVKRSRSSQVGRKRLILRPRAGSAQIKMSMFLTIRRVSAPRITRRVTRPGAGHEPTERPNLNDFSSAERRRERATKPRMRYALRGTGCAPTPLELGEPPQ